MFMFPNMLYLLILFNKYYLQINNKPLLHQY